MNNTNTNSISFDAPVDRWQPVSGPFKCPDCGTWWTGSEHRCSVKTIVTHTTNSNGHECGHEWSISITLKEHYHDDDKPVDPARIRYLSSQIVRAPDVYMALAAAQKIPWYEK